MDKAAHEDRLWERIAFACRYGHVPLSEVLQVDTRHLLSLCNALAKLVRQENGVRS